MTMTRIIEILNQAGEVITQVANSGNPDDDVRAYGGASWRDYVVPDDVRIARLRQRVIDAIKAEGLRRIGLILPALKNLDLLELVIEAVKAGSMAAPTGGSDLDRCRALYVFAKSRISYAQGASEEQLNQYDPAADGWPE